MKYRHGLPQLAGKRILTDGGLETTLLFLDGIDLPGFAAIEMVTSPEKRAHLRRYFQGYIQLALRHGVGFMFESPTWRSSAGWADTVGHSAEVLDELNRLAIEMMLAWAHRYETEASPMVVSGCIGPRGDGYVPSEKMSADQAQDYHQRQIDIFADAGVDCVSAFTMNYVEEAIGIVLAAQRADVPSVISFTVETDGRLITGESLEDAIYGVDEATGQGPAYYMINCAHPSHFESVLDPNAGWVKRIAGIRANASKCSHEELDNSETLDVGNPDELARDYLRLTESLPHITVVGGCCGTDSRHIEAIARYQYDVRKVA